MLRLEDNKINYYPQLSTFTDITHIQYNTIQSKHIRRREVFKQFEYMLMFPVVCILDLKKTLYNKIHLYIYYIYTEFILHSYISQLIFTFIDFWISSINAMNVGMLNMQTKHILFIVLCYNTVMYTAFISC